LPQVTINSLARPRLAYLIRGPATGVNKVAKEVRALSHKALGLTGDATKAAEQQPWPRRKTEYGEKYPCLCNVTDGA
jgi:hypothetical protein